MPLEGLQNVSAQYWFFKLFNSIKEEHEVDFARLELVSLAGPVEPVRNFVDVLESSPLIHFCSDPARIQDVLTYEPCYGRVQGFMAVRDKPLDLERLSRRLAYTREIIGVIEGPLSAHLSQQVKKLEATGRAQSYNAGDYTLVRV